MFSHKSRYQQRILFLIFSLLTVLLSYKIKKSIILLSIIESGPTLVELRLIPDILCLTLIATIIPLGLLAEHANGQNVVEKEKGELLRASFPIPDSHMEHHHTQLPTEKKVESSIDVVTDSTQDVYIQVQFTKVLNLKYQIDGKEMANHTVIELLNLNK